jgi:hypothetical protein
VPTVTGSRNLGVSITSVEWLRSHGGNPIVSQIENWYYQLNEPEKGGPALTSLPQVGVGAAGIGGEAEGSEATHYLPADVNPLIHPVLPGEGVWRKAGAGVGARPPALLTTVRSDPEYPQFVAGVAWLDASRTELEYMPGTVEPPEPLAHRGNGEVPGSMRRRLVATFDGGFPLETSNAGLIYRGRVKETMVNGIATVVRYRDGRTDIVRWNHGPGAPADVWFAKQNLPPIIYEGKLNPNLGDGPEWGETVNNQTELDINEDWTNFISYRRPGASSPSNLLPEMFRSPERYLSPDERDFFAVYLKPGQPW